MKKNRIVQLYAGQARGQAMPHAHSGVRFNGFVASRACVTEVHLNINADIIQRVAEQLRATLKLP